MRRQRAGSSKRDCGVGDPVYGDCRASSARARRRGGLRRNHSVALLELSNPSHRTTAAGDASRARRFAAAGGQTRAAVTTRASRSSIVHTDPDRRSGMDERTRLFDEQRPRLLGLAYRMLCVMADAEDVLQDAYLRWRSVDISELDSPQAWLTTVVTRLSIDRLRRARIEREAYVGPWLPEPLSDRHVPSPESALALEGDLSIAFLVLLETLSPNERAAFLLHDILDEDYADVAAMLGKSEAACRQMVHRARERVTAKRRRFIVDDKTRTEMLRKFIDAANGGDRKALKALLAPDATLISDGGGKAIAARRPLHGAERIAWLWYAVAKRSGDRIGRRIVRANGEPALAQYFDGRLHSVAVIETDGERIHRHYTIANPDKLRSFADISTLVSPA